MRYAYLLIILFIISGCATPTPPIQENDKIWTLKAGTTTNLSYDNKPVTKTFDSDMFVVSKGVLVGNANDAIDSTLDKTKQEAKMKKMLALAGGIVTIIATGLAIYVKTKGVKVKVGN